VDEVRSGVGRGIGFATCFSVIVIVMALLRGSTRYPDGFSTWHVVAFYYGAGILGGAVFGLLRPWQHLRLGKLASAWVILYLVYGGGTIAFYPLVKSDTGRSMPPLGLLVVWAVLCAALAPAYVSIFTED
jgi:hypothetical protein